MKSNINQTGFSIPAIDNPQSTKSVASNILDYVEYSGTFAKSDIEKQRLKELKKAYFRKHKVAHHKLNLTNKQISNTFAAKITITT
jgi:hypothetical protein